MAREQTEHEIAVNEAAAAWCDLIRAHGAERWPADVTALLDKLMRDLDHDEGAKTAYRFATALEARCKNYRAFGRWVD